MIQLSIDFNSRTPDGKVCLNESGELAVTKFAVEPVRVLPPHLTSANPFLLQVWYLPGVAERFGIGMSFSHGDAASIIF